MAWILLSIAGMTILGGVMNLKRNPTVSLIVTALISFTMFYSIGKSGNEEVFITACILFFVIGNAFIFKNKHVAS